MIILPPLLPCLLFFFVHCLFSCCYLRCTSDLILLTFGCASNEGTDGLASVFGVSSAGLAWLQHFSIV